MRWLVLLGCAGCVDLFGNQPPELLSVNGVEVTKGIFGVDRLPEGAGALTFELGEEATFQLEIDDKQEVEVWWPHAPAGFRGPHGKHKATWTVGWLPEAELSLVLRDVHPRNPRSSSWSIPITVLGQFQDTGVESGRVLDTGRLLSNDTTDTR